MDTLTLGLLLAYAVVRGWTLVRRLVGGSL